MTEGTSSRISMGIHSWQWGSLLGLIGVAAARLIDVFLGFNFHVLAEGQCYRSGQPSSVFLTQVASQHHIRTVINLRGLNDTFDWMVTESRTAKNLQLRHVKLGFSALETPTTPVMRQLFKAFEEEPGPYLIHCHTGADRTGLASALFLLFKTDSTLAQARRQLDLFYGHALWGKTRCLDRVLDRYESWLKSEGRTHAPGHLRRWIHEVYDGDF